jgi:hypothetical protein
MREGDNTCGVCAEAGLRCVVNSCKFLPKGIGRKEGKAPGYPVIDASFRRVVIPPFPRSVLSFVDKGQQSLINDDLNDRVSHDPRRRGRQQRHHPRRLSSSSCPCHVLFLL